MATYDVVIAGGGTNGLTIAAYLQKAGLSTCVVELQPYVGGGARTAEVTLPGFKHDTASTVHLAIMANPLIRNDELQLFSKYGFKYAYPENLLSMVFPDNTEITVYKDVDKTCASIAKFSQKDADTYRKFVEWSKPMTQMLVPGMFSPPAPFGAMMAMLDSSDLGREIMRIMLMSAWDLVDEWFESDQIKIMLSRFGSEMMVGAQEGGTGTVILLMLSLLHDCGLGVPIGGSSAIAHALERCVRDNGGTIRTSSSVRSVKIETGRAKGLVLDSGEEILARKAVVSTLHIKQLVPDMVGTANLPADFPGKVARIKPSTFSAFLQALALDEAPNYKAGDTATSTFWVEMSPFRQEYLRGFDDYKYGVPVVDAPLTTCPTLLDPSRAPAGKHVVYLYHYEAFRPFGGPPEKWDEIKQDVGDRILRTFLDSTTNITEKKILGRHMQTPLDLMRSNPSWLEGDFMHFGQCLYQNLSNRPLPGWGRYKSPIEGLYLAGASCHPGPSITGGGRAPVQVMMEDFGIDFEKVIS